MAGSGSLKTNEALWAYVTFEWSVASQDLGNNSTTINWSLVYRQGAGIGIIASYFNLDIDGNRVFEGKDITVQSGKVFGSGQLTLKHNSDGTKSFSVSMEGENKLNFTGTATVKGSGTFELDPIVKPSDISSAGNVTLGNPCSVTWVPASAENKFKICFSIGEYSHTTDFISPGITSAYTYSGFVIPLEVANQIPDSKTGTMTATLYSYDSAGNQAGSGSSKIFTVTVPQSLAPVAKMAVTAINELVNYGVESVYIQGKSRVNVNFEGSSGQYGASLKSCIFTIFGSRYEMNSAGNMDSDIIISSGSVQIRGTVTDSRDYSTSITETIEVLAYATPSVIPYAGNAVVVARENKTGLRIEAGKKFSDLSGNNLCSLSYRYAKSGESFPSEWTEILSEDSAEDRISMVAEGVVLDEKSSYIVEIKAEDALLEKHVLSFAISTEAITFHLKKGGKGAAFGKYAEEDELLDVAWDAKFHSRINGAVINTFDLSTTELNLTMTEEKQSVLIFGPGVFGVLDYDGTSTTWNGTGNVSCSTSGKNISATLPASGRYVIISNNLFS